MDQKTRIHSTNPLESMIQTAASWGLNPKELHYHIISFSSSFTKDGEAWSDIGEKDMSVFDEDEFFLNPKLEIHQDYKIEISTAKPKGEQIEVELSNNKQLTRLKAVLKANPNYIFKKTLALDLMQSIYKMMIKEGYIIGLRIFEFKQDLLKLAHHIKENGIEENMEILIARGVEPLEPKAEHLIYHYKEKINEHRSDVSYQGFAIDVQEGELIAQKIKTFQGRPGRNLKLKLIQVLPIKEEEIFNIKYNEAKVKQVETATSFDYTALTSGYIPKGDNIEIEKIMDFNVVNFKNTGSLYFNLNTPITINIKNPNPMDEAIKSRITLVAQNINIIGNIAADVSLRAKNLSLDGSTHVKCSIQADEAVIKTLKCKFMGGKLRAQNAENAEIIADEVRIKKVVGGVIRADRIYVGEIHGSCECFAKELIVIKKCSGQNRFHICGQEHIETAAGTCEDLLLRKRELLGDEDELPKRLKMLKYNIGLNRPSIALLEKKAKAYLAAGQSVPNSYTKKIRAYGDLVKRYNELVRQKDGLEDAKNELNARLEKAQSELLKTKIINTSGKWSDANEISFHLFYPKIDKLFHSSVIADNIKTFSSVRDEEGNYTLVMSEECDEEMASAEFDEKKES